MGKCTMFLQGIKHKIMVSNRLLLGEGECLGTRLAQVVENIVLFSAEIAGGYSPSILVEMRTALHASQALSQNLSMTLPAGYTPLSLAEGFYLATLGGAEGSANHVHC